MKHRPRVRRLIYVFEKKTEKFIRAYELTSFNLKEVQKVFNQKSKDPMFYAYQITEKEAPYFRRKFGRRFHFRKREYFLDTRKY